MTGSVALDVIIGLVFVYLLYSLLATLIQEIIATNLSFRAKILEKAIIRMLNDETPVKTGFTNLLNRFGSILQLLFKTTDKNLKPGSLADSFYRSPLIKYLAQDAWHSKPSYLDASNFSKVIIDLLRGKNAKPGMDFRLLIQNTLDEGIPDATTPLPKKPIPVLNKDGDTNRFLRSLWADAQGDVEKFKTSLEKWYDDTMLRASGWYKQYTQVVLLIVGLLISIFFNVDTLQIIDKLSNNPKMTALVVQQTDNFLKSHPNLDTPEASKSADTASLKKQRNELIQKSKELLDKDLNGINNLLGLGWEKKGCAWYGWSPKGMESWGLTELGWLLTALAISMGAPFWFDLLNKLMKLRGAIAPSAKVPTGNGKPAEDAKLINPKG